MLEERDTFAALGGRIRSEAQAAWADGRAAETPRPNRTRVSFPAGSRPPAGDGAGGDTLGLVVATDAQGQLEIGLDFHAATFPERVRAHARAHFLRMLDALLQDVDTQIDAVDLLDQDERAQVLGRGAGTGAGGAARRSRRTARGGGATPPGSHRRGRARRDPDLRRARGAVEPDGAAVAGDGDRVRLAGRGGRSARRR